MNFLIYDCFAFYNELELLEIRLNELDPYVDKFVLAEGNLTFQGHPKKFYFDENKQNEAFKPFLDKIIHVKVIDMPSGSHTGPEDWTRETYLTDSMMVPLKQCNKDDVIMVGFGDEICKGKAVETFLHEQFTTPYVCFGLLNAFHYLNNVANTVWYRRKIAKYENICTGLNNYSLYRFYHSEKGNYRIPEKFTLASAAGWHFSWMNPKKDEDRKATWTHGFTYAPSIAGDSFKAYPLTEDIFPKYLCDNKEKFKHLLLEPY